MAGSEGNPRALAANLRPPLAGTHLLELVNDILDLSKIEASKLELHFEKVHFPTLIQDLFVTVAPFAEKHGVELSLESDAGWHSMSDPRKIRQIALNLLSNAIKFGNQKPVAVACRRRDDDGVVLEVADHGTGIASEHLDRIFEEFVQLDQTVEDPGTGLGLAISKRLAEVLGGSLTVTSTPGEGSVFRLEVPPAPQEFGEDSMNQRDVEWVSA